MALLIKVFVYICYRMLPASILQPECGGARDLSPVAAAVPVVAVLATA